MDKAILSATFVSLKTMADGSPRIVLEIEGTLSDVAAFGLNPGTTLAIARITDEAAKEDLQKTALKGGPLSIEAAGLCNNLDFQDWTRCTSHKDAAMWLREYCGIASRAELDHNLDAKRLFIQLKRQFAMR